MEKSTLHPSPPMVTTSQGSRDDTTTDSLAHNESLNLPPPQVLPNHNRVQTPPYIPTMRDMTMQHINDVYSDDSFISHMEGGGGNGYEYTTISPKPSNVSSNTGGGGGGHGHTNLSPTRPPAVMLRVNDILKINPLESEAETLIMKAIERQDMIHQQQQQQRSRANTAVTNDNGTSTLLGNCVPNESIGIFTNTTDGVSKKTTFDETNNAVISPSSNSFDQRGSGNSSRPPRPPPPPPPQQQQLPKPYLARHQTTEETLAALTLAMVGFQDHQHHPPQTNNNNNNNDVSTLANNLHVQSAAEAFAQNANMVFQVNNKHHHPPTAIAPNSPKRHDNEQKLRPSSSSNADENLPISDATTTTTTTTTTAAKLSSHWMKVKDAIQTSTVAEMNGIDVNSSAELLDIHPKNTEELLQDVEIGEDIPFDESVLRRGSHMDGTTEQHIAGSGSQKHPSIHMNSTRSSTVNTNNNYNKGNVLIQALSKGAVQDLQLFIRQRRKSIILYTRLLVLLVIPALTASGLLFYFFDNIPTGLVDIEIYRYNETLFNLDGKPIDTHQASVSWWILFVCVRQALTFSIAQFLQVLIIDFLCLNTRFFTTLLGNLVTLLIAQSKGWPFIVFTWGLLNFAVLHGPSRFASSWLYWQDYVDVFNEVNPGGKVTSSSWNTRILTIAVCVGITVAMKRLWMGLFLGKKTYINYAEELTNVVKKALLLCEVATLARDLYYDSNIGGTMRRMSQFGVSREALSVILHKSIPCSVENEDSDVLERQALVNHDDDIYNGGLIIDSRQGDLLRGHLDQSQRTRLIELLGAWEEPEAEGDIHENVTISSILQFRNSLSLLDSDFMFGIAWGDVSTRAKMVVNSQEVYQRLLLPTPDCDTLKFEVLARVAMRHDGKTLNHDKLEDLIRLLRPDRDGSLSLLDFVKSTDGVYKEMKLLRASIRNSEYIDRAFEKAFNVAFYAVMTCIILSRIGIDPIALFLSLSGLILAFAFMIGSAASKMFEGFLFILVRRPYNIGDRIHISGVESDTKPTGSAGWIVKDVTLFNTTLIYGSTGERATVANGSLASSRVINMARSPKATIGIDLKFPTDAPLERLKVFEQSLRDFVKARPREWANFNGFRAGTIFSDLGYIEYTVSLSHREAWQNIIAIINSKAEVAAFCLELTKQLEVHVQTPTLPVTLTLTSDNNNKDLDLDSQAGKFIRGFGGTGNVPEVDVGEE